MNAKKTEVIITPQPPPHRIEVPPQDIEAAARLSKVDALASRTAVPDATFCPPYTPATIPTGEHLTVQSASPAKLWDDKPVREVPFDARAFARLPPEERGAQVDKLRDQRDALRGQIRARLGQLDEKWKGSRVSTRSQALRRYQHHSGAIDSATRKELERKLDRAEAAQTKIDQLQKKSDKLGASSKNTSERKQVAAALQQARTEQEEAVTLAVSLVENKHLKNDLLAVAEQVIDANAPAAGSGESVLEKLKEFLHLDSLINTIMKVFTVAVDKLRAQNKERREAQLDEDRVAADRLDARLLEARRTQENEVARAALLSDLARLT